MTRSTAASATAPYDELAPFYDDFTADHNYDDWMGSLLDLVAGFRETSGWALDVACGTGKSTFPLVRAGWRVVGADASPAMLERARRRLPPSVELRCVDVRELDEPRRYDLITWMDDAANCMLGPDDLRQALVAIGGALAPGGALIFDVNTTGGYERSFGASHTVHRAGLVFEWRGSSPVTMSPGGLARARLLVSRDGTFISVSDHTQRHYAVEDVMSALSAAGLVARRLCGMTPDGAFHRDIDQDRHHKLIFVASRDASTEIGRR